MSHINAVYLCLGDKVPYSVPIGRHAIYVTDRRSTESAIVALTKRYANPPIDTIIIKDISMMGIKKTILLWMIKHIVRPQPLTVIIVSKSMHLIFIQLIRYFSTVTNNISRIGFDNISSAFVDDDSNAKPMYLFSEMSEIEDRLDMDYLLRHIDDRLDLMESFGDDRNIVIYDHMGILKERGLLDKYSNYTIVNNIMINDGKVPIDESVDTVIHSSIIINVVYDPKTGTYNEQVIPMSRPTVDSTTRDIIHKIYPNALTVVAIPGDRLPSIEVSCRSKLLQDWSVPLGFMLSIAGYETRVDILLDGKLDLICPVFDDSLYKAKLKLQRIGAINAMFAFTDKEWYTILRLWPFVNSLDMLRFFRIYANELGFIGSLIWPVLKEAMYDNWIIDGLDVDVYDIMTTLSEHNKNIYKRHLESLMRHISTYIPLVLGDTYTSAQYVIDAFNDIIHNQSDSKPSCVLWHLGRRQLVLYADPDNKAALRLKVVYI